MKLQEIFRCTIWVISIVCCLPMCGWCGDLKENIILDEMVVEGRQDKGSATKATVEKSVIEIQGGPAQISPYRAISTVPGVDIRTLDPFGMNTSHRIRGKANRNIGETLEGLPLKSIGPGVGLGTMVDLENIESISVSKGAIPPDGGLGYGSDYGMVDMQIKSPIDKFHLTLKQALGEESFSRSYLRLDTGHLGNVARGFVSGSYTDADKWKGEGKSPNGRRNFALGIASIPGQPVEWEFYTIRNYEKKHSYRGLQYDQVKHLSRYHDFDYNRILAGVSKNDAYYYDYNREDFRTYTYFGKIKVPVPFIEQASLTLRPYYLKDEGYSYAGGVSGNSGYVTDWLVDHNCYGGVLEYEQKIKDAQIKAGYWYGEAKPPGPPMTQKKRTITPGTGALVFNSWTKLIRVNDKTHFNSPYISADVTHGPFSVDAGLRYLWWTTPSFTSYKTAGIGDVSAEKALEMATSKKYEVDGKTFEVFLPYIGVTYKPSEFITLRANYGRNYGSVEYSFGSQLDSLYNKGFTEAQLEKLWQDKVRPEESDNFDLGINIALGKFYAETTLFYSLAKYVAGSFYDPGLNETYYQNTGKAFSLGAELLLGYTFMKNLDATLSFMYNNYECTSDYKTATGYVIQAEGNQMPDAPRYMGNLSVNWRIGDLSVNPTVRYLGKTYADVENKYSLDDYFLVDLSASYQIKLFKNFPMVLSVAAINLLDKEYIATVSAGNTSIGETAQTYNVGAPRTFIAALQVDF